MAEDGLVVDVVGLGGPLCSLTAERTMSVRELKRLVEGEVGVIDVQQVLALDGDLLTDPEAQPFSTSGSCQIQERVELTLAVTQAKIRFSGNHLCTFVDDKRYAFEGEVEHVDGETRFTLACQSFGKGSWDWPWSKDPGTFSKTVDNAEIFELGTVPTVGEWCWRYCDLNRKFLTQAVVVQRDGEMFTVQDHGEGDEYVCAGIELHKKVSTVFAAPGRARPRFGGSCLCTLLADKTAAFEGDLAAQKDGKNSFTVVAPTTGYYYMKPFGEKTQDVEASNLYQLGIMADVGDSCWIYHRIRDRGKESQFLTEAVVQSRDGHKLCVEGKGFLHTLCDIDVHKKVPLEVLDRAPGFPTASAASDPSLQGSPSR